MDFKIIPFTPNYRKDFDRLNRWWLEKYFKVEPIDQEVLSKPEQYIINKGGEIFFAIDDQEKAVGVIALMRTKGILEITKMGVLESAQGLGIGKALFETALEKAIEMGYKKVVLFTNTKLKPAYQLYKSRGFNEVPFDNDIYERCNCRMEMYLDTELSIDDLGYVLGDYKNAIESLNELKKSIPASAIDHRPEDGGWTIAQCFKNLVDAEAVAYVKIRQFLDESGTEFPNWNQDTWLENYGTENQSLDADFEMYKMLRASNHWLLRSLNVNQLYQSTLQVNNETIRLIDWLLTFKDHNHFGPIKRIITECKQQGFHNSSTSSY